MKLSDLAFQYWSAGASLVKLSTMLAPLVFLGSYFALGMLTALFLWPMLQDEIEMAISMEDEEMHTAMRISVLIAFVFLWPLVLWDVTRRPRF